MKRTLVAALVLVALVGFGFQTQAFAGTCLKTLCWQLDNYPGFIKASVDCNLKALKTQSFVVTGSYETVVVDSQTVVVDSQFIIAPMVGTLQKIPVSVNEVPVTLNSSPVKKPVMILEGSAFAGFFNQPFVYDGFLHIIFDDLDLDTGIVSGGFPALLNFGVFSGEPISRINCKSCPSNNLDGAGL